MTVVTKIVVSGARGPRGLPSGPLGAGAVDAESISDDSGEQEAILAKLGAASAGDLSSRAASDFSNVSLTGAQVNITTTSGTSAAKVGENILATNSTNVGQYSLRFAALVKTGNLNTGDNDIADTIIARWNSIQSGSGWGEWRVVSSPLAFGSGFTGAPTVAQSFYITTREINPQNRHGDLTWKAEPRLYSNPVAGDQMVAETQDFSGTVGVRVGYNLAWAYWVARSPYTAENTAEHARFNTIVGFSPNAVSPGGTGFFGTGYRVYFYGASPSVAGSGYQVGDRVVLNTGIDQTKNLNPTFEVTSVNGTGGITGVAIFEAGGFEYGTSFSSSYPVTGGTGTGASLGTLLTSVDADERPWSWGGVAGRWAYGIDCLKPNSIKATFSGAFLRVAADTIVVSGRDAADSVDIPLLTWRGDGAIQIGQAGTNVDIPHNLIVAAVRVGANQVVGARQSAIANATDAASAITQLNLTLAALRAHGLIAT